MPKNFPRASRLARPSLTPKVGIWGLNRGGSSPAIWLWIYPKRSLLTVGTFRAPPEVRLEDTVRTYIFPFPCLPSYPFTSFTLRQPSLACLPGKKEEPAGIRPTAQFRSVTKPALTSNGKPHIQSLYPPRHLLGCYVDMTGVEEGEDGIAKCLAPFSEPDWYWGLIQVMMLMLGYGYVLFYASNMLSEGSELLLLVPSLSGLVGSLCCQSWARPRRCNHALLRLGWTRRTSLSWVSAPWRVLPSCCSCPMGSLHHLRPRAHRRHRSGNVQRKGQARLGFSAEGGSVGG